MDDVTVRCFLGMGLQPEDAMAVQVCLAPLRQEPWATDLHWVAPRNWHVTLAFLGNRSLAWLNTLEAECRTCLQELQAAPNLWLQAARVCGFPDARARLVALELTPEPALLALKSALDQGLRRLGVEPEGRAYRPHVTVARFGRGREVPVTPVPCDLALRFCRVTLFQSLQGPAGSEYRSLWSLPFSVTASAT